MNFIRFPFSMSAASKALVFVRAMAITDRTLWLGRYQELKDTITGNPFLEKFVLQEHRIEMGVGFVLQRYKRSQIFPSLRIHPELYDGLSFFHTLYQVHQRLSDDGRKPLSGMVRDGLNKNSSIASSLAFELSVATHFVSNGYSVAFTDLEGLARSDLLVQRNDLIIEIECKHVSGEIGFAVHRRRFLELIRMQMPEIERYRDINSETAVILVTIPKRLHNTDGYYLKLTHSITQTLRERR